MNHPVYFNHPGLVMMKIFYSLHVPELQSNTPAKAPLYIYIHMYISDIDETCNTIII